MVKENKIINFFTNDGIETDMDLCDYCQMELVGVHANKKTCILISKSCIPIVSAFTWYLGKDNYPVAYNCNDIKTIKLGRGLKLHKLLMGKKCPKGMVIDHINRNKLDNRLENLRVCTPQENSYNTSRRTEGYKGVINNGKNGFSAQITKDGVKHEINNIETEKEAAIIYDAMAEELFGAYAGKNFSS